MYKLYLASSPDGGRLGAHTATGNAQQLAEAAFPSVGRKVRGQVHPSIADGHCGRI